MLNSIWFFSSVFLDIALLTGAVELLIPNVASGGEATQSSTYHHSQFDDPDGAHYAIDGNFATAIHDAGARCAITHEDPGAWWQVDLKYEFQIEKVAVTTRKAVPQRLKDIYIDVSNNTDGSSAQNCVFDDQPYMSSETRVYTCPSSIQGRYVRIRFLPSIRQHLQICEVQVQGACLQGATYCAQMCSIDDDCSNIPGTICVSDYCQKVKCSFNGECVHGQVCSQNQKCTYRQVITAEEGLQLELKFIEPATSGKYVKIEWYKGSKELARKIAIVLHSLSDQAQYFDEYCSENGPCQSSSKGVLDPNTGTMTINSVEITDEDYYYYYFSTYGRVAKDTGEKYEIKVEVYVKPKQEDLKIDVSESETEVNLMCSITRTKPKAADMFFTIAGQRYNGTIVSMMNVDLTYTNSLKLSLSQVEDIGTVQCTIVPVYGEPLSLVKDIALNQDASSATNVGLIAGIVVGVLLLSIIVIVVIVVFVKRYRCFIIKKNDPPPEYMTPDGPSTVSSTVQSAEYEYLQLDKIKYANTDVSRSSIKDNDQGFVNRIERS